MICFTLLDTVLLVLDLFTATGSKWLLVSTEDSFGPGNVLVEESCEGNQLNRKQMVVGLH